MLQFHDADGDQRLGEARHIGAQRCHFRFEGRPGLSPVIIDEPLAPAEIDRQQPHGPDLCLVQHVGAAGILLRLRLALPLALLPRGLPVLLSRALRPLLSHGRILEGLGTGVVLEVLVGAQVDRDQPERTDLGLVEQVRTWDPIAGDDALRALDRPRHRGLGDARGHVEIRLH